MKLTGFARALLMALILGSGVRAQQEPKATDADAWDSFHARSAGLAEAALRSSPSLRALGQVTRAARESAAAQGGLAPPVAGVEFMQSTLHRPMRKFEYSAEQMFMAPPRIRTMRLAEMQRAEMSRFDSAAAALNLVRDVRLAVNELYYLDRMAEVNTENAALLRELIAALRTRYEVGSVGRQGMLRAETALCQALSDSAETAGMRGSAEAMLGGLLGDTAARPIPLFAAFALPAISPEAEETLIARALAYRPEIMAMAAQVRMDSLALLSARAGRIPEFSLRASFRDDVTSGEDAVGLMAGMSIPSAPWSAVKVRAPVAQAAAQLAASRASLASMQAMVRSEVRAAHARVMAALIRCSKFDASAFARADDALHSSLAEYRAGMNNLDMVIDDARMKSMARKDYYMSVKELLDTMVALDRAAATNHTAAGHDQGANP